MRRLRSRMLLLLVAGILAVCPGCKHVDDALNYESMTGGIPQDSWLSTPMTGGHK